MARDDPLKLILNWTDHIEVPQWVDPASCSYCGHCRQTFTRGHKHCCRLCGKLFCTRCTEKMHMDIKYKRKGKVGAQRTCYGCIASCIEQKFAFMPDDDDTAFRHITWSMRKEKPKELYPPEWVDKAAWIDCFKCHTAGRARDAHNCRCCGRLYCSTCTIKVLLPDVFSKKKKTGPQRVCDNCRYLLKAGWKLMTTLGAEKPRYTSEDEDELSQLTSELLDNPAKPRGPKPAIGGRFAVMNRGKPTRPDPKQGFLIAEGSTIRTTTEQSVVSVSDGSIVQNPAFSESKIERHPLPAAVVAEEDSDFEDEAERKANQQDIPALDLNLMLDRKPLTGPSPGLQAELAKQAAVAKSSTQTQVKAPQTQTQTASAGQTKQTNSPASPLATVAAATAAAAAAASPPPASPTRSPPASPSRPPPASPTAKPSKLAQPNVPQTASANVANVTKQQQTSQAPLTLEDLPVMPSRDRKPTVDATKDGSAWLRTLQQKRDQEEKKAARMEAQPQGPMTAKELREKQAKEARDLHEKRSAEQQAERARLLALREAEAKEREAKEQAALRQKSIRMLVQQHQQEHQRDQEREQREREQREKEQKEKEEKEKKMKETQQEQLNKLQKEKDKEEREKEGGVAKASHSHQSFDSLGSIKIPRLDSKALAIDEGSDDEVEKDDDRVFVEVLWDDEGNPEDDELALTHGELLQVLDNSDPHGWWRGVKVATGQEGVFPHNLVRIIPRHRNPPRKSKANASPLSPSSPTHHQPNSAPSTSSSKLAGGLMHSTSFSSSSPTAASAKPWEGSAVARLAVQAVALGLDDTDEELTDDEHPPPPPEGGDDDMPPDIPPPAIPSDDDAPPPPAPPSSSSSSGPPSSPPSHPLPSSSSSVQSSKEKEEKKGSNKSKTTDMKAKVFAAAIPSKHPPQKKKKLRVVATHPYTADDADELTILPGDSITVLKRDTEGWWMGRNDRTGGVGLFPWNYVKEVQ